MVFKMEALDLVFSIFVEKLVETRIKFFEKAKYSFHCLEKISKNIHL